MDAEGDAGVDAARAADAANEARRLASQQAGQSPNDLDLAIQKYGEMLGREEEDSEDEDGISVADNDAVIAALTADYNKFCKVTDGDGGSGNGGGGIGSGSNVSPIAIHRPSPFFLLALPSITLNLLASIC